MTAILIVCLIFTVGILGTPIRDSNHNVFIIGGNIANENQFSFMASLRIQNNHFCAGTIINSKWILTAGHCASGTNKKLIRVVVGTNTLSSGGISYKVSDLIPNENFQNGKLFIVNDIALLKIEGEIAFNDRVQPIKLCTRRPKINDDATVIGWGYYLPNHKIVSEHLRYLDSTIMNPTDCINQMYPALVLGNEICCQVDSESGACNGDSGGPLIDNGTQIGIVSWGIECAQGFPDVYANVCDHLEWINNIIETH